MLSCLTWLHVLISLLGIVSGIFVVGGFLVQSTSAFTVAVFLVATITTSATGFLFPAAHFLPSHVVGIVSLLVLALTCYARYGRLSEGGWGKVFVIGSITALYLNVFVGTVQSFLKIPALKAAAPTQSEPPFKVVQLAILLLFIALGTASLFRNRVRSSVFDKVSVTHDHSP